MRLTARQWAEWAEYARIEPFGFPVEDLHHGILCTTIAAPHTRKGAKAPRPVDFMVKRDEYQDESEPTVEQTESALDLIFGLSSSPPTEGGSSNG